MPELYFAYASNMDPMQFHCRCPKAKPLGRARLPERRLAFTRCSRRWRGGVADVVEDASSAVWGVLYEVDEACLATLDRCEGVCKGAYRREQVKVFHYAGQPQEAITYVANRTGDFRPSRSYLEVILRGARAYGLPAEYIAALERIKTV